MTVLYPIVLIAAGLLAYANSFTGVFLLDEHPNVVYDPSTQSFTGTLRALRPVVALSLRVNYWLGVHDVAGYHAFNLAVHLLAALTLYALLRRTLQHFPSGQPARTSATGLAFAVALLWLTHPLQTQ